MQSILTSGFNNLTQDIDRLRSRVEHSPVVIRQRQDVVYAHDVQAAHRLHHTAQVAYQVLLDEVFDCLRLLLKEIRIFS